MGKLWEVATGDSLEWLKSLETRSAGLVFFSPPYEAARTYGIGFKLTGQKWVDWMRPIIVEAARVSNGLVLVNAAGQVRKHRYSPIMEFLTADLVRLDGLVMGPSPYAWTKASGIPGSGNKVSGYHRRNWEPVYGYCLPDRLPLVWNDQLAFGHKPKWGPGGEMSNRIRTGTRVNQWGQASGIKSGGHTGKNGKRNKKPRPSHIFVDAEEARNEWGMAGGTGMKRANGTPRVHGKKKTTYCGRGMTNGLLGTPKGGCLSQPAIANPGNVIHTNVGGGHQGHKAAHKSVAPMPVALAERFVCWFCDPMLPLIDPFCGSGTSGHAALKHGRMFLGCDIDPEQVKVTRKRLESITPSAFN